MGIISKLIKNHQTAIYGTTALAMCAASAYGSLSSQPVTGQDLEVLIRKLPDELLVSGDLLTVTKAAAIAFSAKKLLKNSKRAFVASAIYESVLEGAQFFLPYRFFDPVDFVYILLGAALGPNIDTIGNKIINKCTRLRYE